MNLTPDCRVPSHKARFSCLQYNFPPRLAARVARWGRINIPDDFLYAPPEDSTYGREDCIHCTLFFGIHGDAPEAVQRVLRDEPPFEFRLGVVSCFSNDRYDVAKIDVDSPELHRLHEKIACGVPCTEPYSDYQPHVTIAYLKSRCGPTFVGDDTFDGVTVPVKTLTFSSKQGPQSLVRLNKEELVMVD